MNNLSEQKKSIFEEFLFQGLCSVVEYYFIGRVLRKIQSILNSDIDWIKQNIPAHREKLLSLKDDADFYNELDLEVRTLISNCGLGKSKLPSWGAEFYYRILEYCYDTSSHEITNANYNWFRDYVKVNGRLEKRLQTSNVKLHFNLPIVPAQTQKDNSWARVLKNKMLMNHSTLMPDTHTPKSCNGRTEKVKNILKDNNDEYFKNAEYLITINGQDSSNLLIKYNETTRILNLFLDKPYQRLSDLSKLESEFNIDRNFK